MSNVATKSSMSDEEIRIAVAETCGWLVRGGLCFKPEPASGFGHGPATKKGWALPDYLNDLNACHEMENALDDESLEIKSRWFIWLQKNGDVAGVRATARQRCEAFLRTKGLWRESNSTRNSTSGE